MTFARRRDLRVDKRLGTPHTSDASACGTKILLLDERTKGIQPNVMQQIGNALELLRRQGDMAIVLVWQNADFACRIANAFTIMELGCIKNVAAMSAYVQAMLGRLCTLETHHRLPRCGTQAKAVFHFCLDNGHQWWSAAYY